MSDDSNNIVYWPQFGPDSQDRPVYLLVALGEDHWIVGPIEDHEAAFRLADHINAGDVGFISEHELTAEVHTTITPEEWLDRVDWERQ